MSDLATSPAKQKNVFSSSLVLATGSVTHSSPTGGCLLKVRADTDLLSTRKRVFRAGTEINVKIDPSYGSCVNPSSWSAAGGTVMIGEGTTTISGSAMPLPPVGGVILVVNGITLCKLHIRRGIPHIEDSIIAEANNSRS